MQWEREPFYGGCRYCGENNLVVVGYYSPADPLEFESDCKKWTASNILGRTFESSKEAMDAAEHIFEAYQKLHSYFIS